MGIKRSREFLIALALLATITGATKLFYSPTTRPLPSLVTLMKVWQAEGMTAICSVKSC